MKVALYTGNHESDSMPVRAGWWITKKVQKGPFACTTHVEAIHCEHSDGSITMASSSIRDGGVRSKDILLNPLRWNIVDVPMWDVQDSIKLLTLTQGSKYDLRGAIATAFIGSPQAGRYFCNQWVGLPYLQASATFGPNHFHAICLSLGKDITKEFFEVRK